MEPDLDALTDFCTETLEQRQLHQSHYGKFPSTTSDAPHADAPNDSRTFLCIANLCFNNFNQNKQNLNLTYHPTGKNPSIALDASTDSLRRIFAAMAIVPKSVWKIPTHYAGGPPTLMRGILSRAEIFRGPFFY